MKIAVNTRLLLKDRLEGIGWFTYETFKRIAQQHPEHEFHFLFDRAYSNEFIFGPNVTPHVLHPQARRPLLMKLWYDFAVPRKLRQIGADVFVSPDCQMSLRTDVPQIIVIHDINFEHYPQDVPAIYTSYLKERSPRWAKKAERIITVSAFSKADIAKQYHVSPDKIDVAHNGINDTFEPLSELEILAVKADFTNGKDYFVFVGSIHPRKNLQRLLPAFDQFKAQTGSDMKLVVVGKKFWFSDEIKSAFESMRHADDVIFTERLNADALHRVVGAAMASAYISYFEGFGIPIVEGFKLGVPVITSNVTAMPEVAGDAALIVDPFSIEEIKQALYRMWSEPTLRQSLIERGLERAKHFNWQATADAVWKTIEQVTTQHRG